MRNELGGHSFRTKLPASSHNASIAGFRCFCCGSSCVAHDCGPVLADRGIAYRCSNSLYSYRGSSPQQEIIGSHPGSEFAGSLAATHSLGSSAYGPHCPERGCTGCVSIPALKSWCTALGK